jgi:hypothetical protein
MALQPGHKLIAQENAAIPLLIYAQVKNNSGQRMMGGAGHVQHR